MRSPGESSDCVALISLRGSITQDGYRIRRIKRRRLIGNAQSSPTSMLFLGMGCQFVTPCGTGMCVERNDRRSSRMRFGEGRQQMPSATQRAQWEESYYESFLSHITISQGNDFAVGKFRSHLGHIRDASQKHSRHVQPGLKPLAIRAVVALTALALP